MQRTELVGFAWRKYTKWPYNWWTNKNIWIIGHILNWQMTNCFFSQLFGKANVRPTSLRFFALTGESQVYPCSHHTHCAGLWPYFGMDLCISYNNNWLCPKTEANWSLLLLPKATMDNGQMETLLLCSQGHGGEMGSYDDKGKKPAYLVCTFGQLIHIVMIPRHVGSYFSVSTRWNNKKQAKPRKKPKANHSKSI